jgi:hypothetical protein
MPWNSSKSDINPSRPAFAQIRPIVITLVKHFTKLSRRLKKGQARLKLPRPPRSEDRTQFPAAVSRKRE